MSRAARMISVLVALAGLLGLWAVIAGNRSTTGSGAGRLIIFHAGSLSVPFTQICDEFKQHHPGMKIVREVAGSRECARKIADLDKPCDVMASADYVVIDSLLIPEHADWSIRFASNEMVIAFREDSRHAAEINEDNWHEVLIRDGVTFGRSDPNLDPAGYRTVLTARLAEKLYGKPGLAPRLLAKDVKYIRPMSADLLALLEVGELDYLFTYRSVAEQHKLAFIALPDQINFGRAELAKHYSGVSVRLIGKKMGTFTTHVGEPIIYGVTIPKSAPNPELAEAFLAFLLDAHKGGRILLQNGQASVVPSPTDTYEQLPESLRRFALPMPREGRP